MSSHLLYFPSLPLPSLPLISISISSFTFLSLCRFGASLIVKGEVTFVQMMTAILSLMLGALGLGQAVNELGIMLYSTDAE